MKRKEREALCDYLDRMAISMIGKGIRTGQKCADAAAEIRRLAEELKYQAQGEEWGEESRTVANEYFYRIDRARRALCGDDDD